MSSSSTLQISRPLWAEIDLAALRANVKIITAFSPIIAVIKANAYGHGTVPVASALLEDQRVLMLAVAGVEEGIELRRSGIMSPILLLSAILPEQSHAVVEHDLTATIGTLEVAKALNEAARAFGKIANVHWKIDTGMSRVGTWHEEIETLLAQLLENSHLQLSGVYTHFACADDEDETLNRAQLERFVNARAVILRKSSREKIIFHAANSAAAFRYDDARFDAVRPGVSLYGVNPFGFQNPAAPANLISQLSPVMNLRARVTEIRDIGKGRTVSYGATWRAARDSRLALLPVGYADGYRRALSNRGEVLIGGRRCPVVGRVTMDQSLVDVTDLPAVSVGDLVTIWGKDESGRVLPVEEVAAKIDTIGYELLTGVSARVPRVYGN